MLVRRWFNRGCCAAAVCPARQPGQKPADDIPGPPAARQTGLGLPSRPRRGPPTTALARLRGQGFRRGQPAVPAMDAGRESRCRRPAARQRQGSRRGRVPETPIREGSECGAAAPMKLVSVGRNPPVALSPPPVVTCDLIAALSRWMARDVQPLARKHLGAPVIRIETMSSYSCRNAYGRKDRRLSEHGRANALDIGLRSRRGARPRWLSPTGGRRPGRRPSRGDCQGPS